VKTALLAGLVLSGCVMVSLVAVERAAGVGTPAEGVHELWVEPTDLEQRDLCRGPSDGPPPPVAKDSFAFVARDTSGRSPGYDVKDGDGVIWSVKLGPEAQAEVVAARLLWALGFHQPPTYYLASWTLSGPDAGPKEGGRFRPEIDAWKPVGDSNWAEFPLANTAANGGLLVAQMMINNWDLKSSNNKIIERGADATGPARFYIVRDLGASLGSNEQAKWLRWTQMRIAQGSKNDLAGFEESGFIDGVEDGYVKFSYSGPNKYLVSRVTPEHVRWTAKLFARLSDQQWKDAFRAGGYPPEDAARYIAKFKQKIAEGLTLQASVR
jgi:hypothetical protein